MRIKNKKHLLILLVFLILNLLPHIYFSLSEPSLLLNWYESDDAFYYFKTAQNIAQGRGITFDGLSPTNGFHPLWMLICVPIFALAKFDLYLPLRILVVFQGFLNGISGYLIYRILADQFSPPSGLAAASLWMFLPSIHAITSKLGLETSINAVSILLLILMVSKFNALPSTEKGYLSLFHIGLAGVFCLLSRLDNIFIIGMMGIWLIFHDNQLRYYSMLDFLLITAAVLVSYYMRMQFTENLFNFLPFAYCLLLSSLTLKPLMLYIFGGYCGTENKTIGQIVIPTVIALTVSSALIAVVVFLLFEVFGIFKGYSRYVLAIDFLLSAILLTTVRIFRWKHCKAVGCDEVDISFASHWKKWLDRTAAFFLPVFISLGIYMLLNKIYAGSAMPVSGKIKHWWGTLPNTIYGRPINTLSGVIRSFFDPNPEAGPFWLIASPMQTATNYILEAFKVPGSTSASLTSFISVILWIGLAAILFVVIYPHREEVNKKFDQSALPALALGCFLHILSYHATGYLHTRNWYWLGEMALVFMFLGIIIDVAVGNLKKHIAFERAINGILILLSFGLVIVFMRTLMAGFLSKGSSRQLYHIEAEKQFIEEETQPGDVIGMTGGGVLGYFIPDRTFVNLDGLINSPAYFDLMKSNRTDLYFDEINLNYVYGDGKILLDSDPYRWMFTDKLRMIAPGPSFWLYEYCGDGCDLP